MQKATFMTALCLAGVFTTSAQGATLVGNYELGGSYASSTGGASLSGNGGTFVGSGPTAGLSFGPNEGPTFSGGLGSVFSIELYFSLQTVAGYRKIVDFLNRGSDTGLYVNGGLNFYPVASGGALTANQLAHVVFTRSAGGTATAFLNGAQVLSFNDSGNLAVNNNLHFFRDDFATGQGEASAGFVDFIRLYDGALSSAEVANLYNNGNPLRIEAVAGVPEPATWAMMLIGFGFVGGAIRSAKQRRKITVSYT